MSTVARLRELLDVRGRIGGVARLSQDELSSVQAALEAYAHLQDRLAAVLELAAKWEAETEAAVQKCGNCDKPIMRVAPFRLYPHVPDLISEYLHADGASFCDGSPESRRARPGVFIPSNPLAELREALTDEEEVV